MGEWAGAKNSSGQSSLYAVVKRRIENKTREHSRQREQMVRDEARPQTVRDKARTLRLTSAAAKRVLQAGHSDRVRHRRRLRSPVDCSTSVQSSEPAISTRFRNSQSTNFGRANPPADSDAMLHFDQVSEKLRLRRSLSRLVVSQVTRQRCEGLSLPRHTSCTVPRASQASQPAMPGRSIRIAQPVPVREPTQPEFPDIASKWLHSRVLRPASRWFGRANVASQRTNAGHS